MKLKSDQLSYSLNQLYKVIGISKQAVSKYQKREKEKAQKTVSVLNEVDAIRSEHPGCGVEKMYYMLRPGWIGRDNFIELLISNGYRVKKVKNYVRTTYSVMTNYYPNKIEGMQLLDINRLLQSDITYFMVGDKFYYLTFIEDVYSRRIIGYASRTH